jgi:hypothetical protein
MENNFEFIIEKNYCGNLEELIELSKSYYSDVDIVNKEYLYWQYLKNPSGRPFLFTSREIKSNILAGQYLVIPIEFNVFEEVVLGSLSLNTLTSPKFQGMGLFTKMAKATYEDCSKNNAFFTIGFPNSQSYPGFVKKLNFRHLGDIPLLLKPLNYNIFLTFFLKKNRVKHGGTIEIFDIIDDKVRVFDTNDKNDQEKYIIFWKSIKHQYAVGIDKNIAFLRWRYGEIPTRNYKLFCIEEANVIKGIIILKAEHVWGMNVGIIMDLLVLDNNLQVGKGLLNFTEKLFRKCNIDMIIGLHSNSYENLILNKNCFIRIPKIFLPQKIHFIFRKNKDFCNSDCLFDIKNWKLTFGDYDVF